MLNPSQESPEALESSQGGPKAEPESFQPLPASGWTVPHANQSHPLSPLVCDEKAIVRLLETLLSKGRVSLREAARRMGTNDNSLRQYLHGRRTKPSLYWFIKLVEACGGRVLIEWPR